MSTRLILGGLLQGTGQGIAHYGVQLRDAKLQAIDRMAREDERERDRRFRAGEADRDRGFRADQADIDRGFRAGQQEDQQEFLSGESQKKRDTDQPLKDARTGLVEAQTEFEKAKTESERATPGGRSNSAAVQRLEYEKATWMQSSEGRQRDGESDDAYKRRTADWMAKRITQDKDLSETDIAKLVMKAAQSDTRWLIAETREEQQAIIADYSALYTGARQGVSGKRPEQAAPTAAPAPAPGQQSTNEPAGGGTRENPFIATTQEQIEWFKQHAPAGAIIIIDGKPYRK